VVIIGATRPLVPTTASTDMSIIANRVDIGCLGGAEEGP